MKQPTVRGLTLSVCLVATLCTALLTLLSFDPKAVAVEQTRQSTVRVHRQIPKEPGGFTQGLEVRKGIIYESVGLRGASQMRLVDLKSGKVTKRRDLDQKYFAEGSTIMANGQILQMTWQEQIAIRRDPKTLAEKGTFTYEGEGWGICNSQALKALVHSDGSSTLRFRDPKTFKETGRLTVKRFDGSEVTQLNELECEGTSVFANLWTSSEIVEINGKTGTILRSIDASSLAPKSGAPDDVLNGIAALGKGRYLLTGKRWPNYYEVSFADITKS